MKVSFGFGNGSDVPGGPGGYPTVGTLSSVLEISGIISLGCSLEHSFKSSSIRCAKKPWGWPSHRLPMTAMWKLAVGGAPRLFDWLVQGSKVKM
jgi:hypothetical protein